MEESVKRVICERLAGGESLRTICADSDMPVCSTVFKYLALDAVFAEHYTRAREMQTEAMLEDIMEIADNATDDVMFLTADDESGESGKPVIKHSAIQRARLQIDTRKWAMGKLKPKKYGDKQIIAGDEDAPIKLDAKIEIVHVKP